jgi:hypothetical protein
VLPAGSSGKQEQPQKKGLHGADAGLFIVKMPLMTLLFFYSKKG